MCPQNPQRQIQPLPPSNERRGLRPPTCEYPHPRVVHRQAERGAALLTAMLIVALVATLASAALWQQWRQVEIETAERGRSQTAWMMTGALDWTRLILREDGLSSGAVDHLGEPWALPVQESKLSNFLSQDQKWQEGDAEVFLSGQITDAQSRLNVRNLIEDGQVSKVQLARFARLFERLDLPLQELQTLSRQLQAALQSSTSATAGNTAQTPLLPQQTAQLVWLGLSPATARALEGFVSVLPEATPVNLNTASAEVLMASLPGLDLAAARQLVQQRDKAPWTSLDAVRQALGAAGTGVNEQQHSVGSRYFEVLGRMRIDNVVQQDLALVRREGNQVRMLWRVRSPQLTLAPTLQ
ncbi:general secretion pathway protein GspK [Limnohabitans sp. T6-5]|uniref:type II secretion system minor pseudopilin GspK n=1 Tax=Limnohabitans sp. T6-5 TaxID=1100724 RepID=UPI000D348F13|nr:type II secretion system minor pseudopilin GspK [Limnohabitans sp. T6-5]PUE06245.1 general secretion pathway protein GspK [Limnohabitans sp. T6-5]